MLEAATISSLSSIATSGVATLSSVATQITAGLTQATQATVAVSKPFWPTVLGFLHISKTGGQLLDMFHRGGPFMWPILIASLIGVGYLLDRLVSLSSESRATVRMLEALKAMAKAGRADLQRLEAFCSEFANSPLSTMAAAGLEKLRAGETDKIDRAVERAGMSEMARLEKGLPALASVSNIAPLIGFLGTVWGIILAFHIIGVKKVVNAQDVSQGISQALIMSAAGLAVAIPVSGAYNYFATRVGRIAVMMQQGAYLLSQVFTSVEKAGAEKTEAELESERGAKK